MAAVWPTIAWLGVLQTSVKLTVQVIVSPGPRAPRSIVPWLPGTRTSPSAGIVSANTAVADKRKAPTARPDARRISARSIALDLDIAHCMGWAGTPARSLRSVRGSVDGPIGVIGAEMRPP